MGALILQGLDGNPNYFRFLNNSLTLTNCESLKEISEMACVTPARSSRGQTLNPLIHLYVYLLVVFVGFILCNQLVNVRPRATNTKLSCCHNWSKCMCCFERQKHHWKPSGLYSSIQKHKTAINYQPLYHCFSSQRSAMWNSGNAFSLCNWLLEGGI